MAVILGCDPGLSGALCLMDGSGTVCEIIDMPTLYLSRNGKSKREVDAYALSRLLPHPIGHAFIEQVWAMPAKGAHAQGKGQGPSSAFAMGKGYGILIGVLAAKGTPMTFVSPKVWKKDLGVPASKDGARARAKALLTHAEPLFARVKDEGRAESALICLWGVRSLNAIFGQTAAELITQPVRERAGSSAPSVDRP